MKQSAPKAKKAAYIRKKTLRGDLIILPEMCKGCGFCIEFCPQHVLEFSGELNSRGYVSPQLKSEGTCTTCAFCQWICPDLAIYVIKENGTEK